jgi:basic membrane protein A
MQKKLWHFIVPILVVASVLLDACAPAPGAPAAGTAAPAGTTTETAAAPATEATAAPAADAGSIQIPQVEEGKFNVAFVYVGPIGDGGWTYAHNEGRLYLENAMSDTVHTAYLESVPEGADAERVIRNLARAGFNAIFTTSFGYMDSTATVAEEFPDTYFVHVSGYKKNDTNFANLFGSMESMKYLVGMIAGARAAADGKKKVGYIAPFPIPEVVRLGNAISLGMRKTCPDCTLDIRWIFTWFDPTTERQAAESLIQSGADVVITGADTTGPVQAADEAGVYSVGYDSRNACDTAPKHCLTVPYWNWGPTYTKIVKEMMDKTFKPDDIYLDVDSGLLGLLGFMDGQTPNPAIPADTVKQVEDVLAKMKSGEFDRFDVFSGPIKDNKGKEIVPAGSKLTQSDLEGIDATIAAQTGRPACTYCMNWLAEGVSPDAELPKQ